MIVYYFSACANPSIAEGTEICCWGAVLAAELVTAAKDMRARRARQDDDQNRNEEIKTKKGQGAQICC